MVSFEYEGFASIGRLFLEGGYSITEHSGANTSARVELRYTGRGRRYVVLSTRAGTLIVTQSVVRRDGEDVEERGSSIELSLEEALSLAPEALRERLREAKITI